MFPFWNIAGYYVVGLQPTSVSRRGDIHLTLCFFFGSPHFFCGVYCAMFFGRPLLHGLPELHRVAPRARILAGVPRPRSRAAHGAADRDVHAAPRVVAVGVPALVAVEHEADGRAERDHDAAVRDDADDDLEGVVAIPEESLHVDAARRQEGLEHAALFHLLDVVRDAQLGGSEPTALEVRLQLGVQDVLEVREPHELRLVVHRHSHVHEEPRYRVHPLEVHDSAGHVRAGGVDVERDVHDAEVGGRDDEVLRRSRGETGDVERLRRDEREELVGLGDVADELRALLRRCTGGDRFLEQRREGLPAHLAARANRLLHAPAEPLVLQRGRAEGVDDASAHGDLILQEPVVLDDLLQGGTAQIEPAVRREALICVHIALHDAVGDEPERVVPAGNREILGDVNLAVPVVDADGLAAGAVPDERQRRLAELHAQRLPCLCGFGVNHFVTHPFAVFARQSRIRAWFLLVPSWHHPLTAKICQSGA